MYCLKVGLVRLIMFSMLAAPELFEARRARVKSNTSGKALLVAASVLAVVELVIPFEATQVALPIRYSFLYVLPLGVATMAAGLCLVSSLEVTAWTDESKKER